MEVIYLTHESEIKNYDPQVMAIGFFDGVHLGHQTLFQKTKEIAAELGVKSAALTFSPHPDEVLKGDDNKKYLTPLKEKIQRISRYELDKLYVMKFDRQFASLPPQTFIDQYIIGMNVEHVVVGFDFTFGYKAKGSARFLQEQAKKKCFQVTVVPKITFMDEKISSTLIRKLLLEGNVELIPYILGNHYEFIAKLRKLDKNEGYYTVHTIDKFLLPKSGQYTVSVETNKGTIQGNMIVSENHELVLQIKEPICITGEQRIAFISKLIVKETVLVSP